MKYPVYIISKGRWDCQYTAKSLDSMGVNYRVCVEPAEAEKYADNLPADKILILPSDFSEQGFGSIPVRNWVWEQSLAAGDRRHWLLDDNINGFERLNRNQRGRVYTDGIFRASEDFVDRYKNIAFAGFEYRQFGGGARRKKPAFKLNYRVYSCTLINNATPFRWRGKYNEDTDICLRALKAGWVTVTFNAFLQNKLVTLGTKGGNTDTIYNTGDERQEFAYSLKRQHPDVVKVVRRYGRYHHEVNYKMFSGNRLEFIDGYKPAGNKVNEYGMIKCKL